MKKSIRLCLMIKIDVNQNNGLFKDLQWVLNFNKKEKKSYVPASKEWNFILQKLLNELTD